MKITTKVQTALNGQINKELESSYIYLSMVAFFEDNNFSGMARWMKKQSNEEINHAMKLFGYVYSRDGEVELSDIKAASKVWKSPLEAFQAAYEHEKFITASINEVVDVAKEDNDKATESFLKWFIDEQVEEEESALDVVNKLKMAGDNKGALFMLDQHLGRRE